MEILWGRKMKFKVGDKVIIHKPKDDWVDDDLVWIPPMDAWDGVQGTVAEYVHLHHIGLIEDHGQWSFHEDWCELVGNCVNVIVTNASNQDKCVCGGPAKKVNVSFFSLNEIEVCSICGKEK
jgi:hypothetical protein